MNQSFAMVFGGIKTRLADTDLQDQDGNALAALSSLLTGGVYRDAAPSRTVRPYAVVKLIQEAPIMFTNKGQYDQVLFEIEVIAETAELGNDMMGHVDNAIMARPLRFDGGRQVSITPAAVQTNEELLKNRTAKTYSVRVGRPKFAR